MLNILLVVHVVIAVLLISVILLQKNSADALAGLGGGNNMGVVSARGAANFMTRMTVILAIAFMVNSLVLANLSNKSAEHKDNKGLSEKLQEDSKKVPMAE
jgi:preprotein translocase subunit SecG